MKPRIVTREQFGEQLFLAVTKLVERNEMSFQEVGKGYLRTSASIEVIITAKKKKPKGDPKPEPQPPEVCCICIRDGSGIIVCTGNCCSVLIDLDVD